MNTPVFEAKRFYEESEFVDRTGAYPDFFHYLDAFHAYGFVVSTPEVFVCARPVPRDALPRDIDDPAHEFPREKCDCWFVGLMAGDLSRIWDYYPIELPYAMWYNGGRRYVVPMNKARSRLTGRANRIKG